MPRPFVGASTVDSGTGSEAEVAARRKGKASNFPSVLETQKSLYLNLRFACVSPQKQPFTAQL